ncbi:cysteine proteinase inhibitor 1-like [Abeliophyllum distichum]|uniref:Cysteine proteinase inhibitor 1-like n=1 Tax=Abeliophyllum distichum TaxID=126358 RepID=A0ABD1QHL4_9LAMI
MATISHSLLLVLTFLVAVSTLLEISTALGGRKAEVLDTDFRPADPKDPKVVEVAEYAINEQNKEFKTNLKFDHVWKAAYQVVQKTTYALIIFARDGSTLGKYDAEVLLNGNSKKLVAFSKA